MNCLYQTKRISKLKEKMLSSNHVMLQLNKPNYYTIYQENENYQFLKKELFHSKPH